MKKILLLTLLVCQSVAIMAANIKVGNLWYKVNDDKTEATVIAVPDGEEGSYTGSIIIPPTISLKISEDPEEYLDVPVTFIGVAAFYNTAITEVSIPASVTRIYDDAFLKCDKIEKVTFASIESLCNTFIQNTAAHPLNAAKDGSLFIGDSPTEATKITIPEGITGLLTWCFYNCKHITSVTIPSTVTSIGGYAFYNCSSLSSINIPENISKIESSTFENCSSLTSIIIPNSVITIGGYAFKGCSSLTSITIPNSVTEIKEDAFDGDTKLAEAKFASAHNLCSIDYSTIKSNPLYYAHNLYFGNTLQTNLEIPESSLKNDTTIRKHILAGASGLIRVTLPGAAKKIESNAFDGCTGLQYVNYATKEQVLDMDYSGSLKANPMYYAKQLLINNAFASNLTINQDLKDGAFPNATWLVNVTIEEGVKHIGNSAFEGCTNLSLVNLPSTLETIGERAFWGCSSLAAPTLPDGLTSIGLGAFHDCKSGSFKEIVIPNNCTLGDEVFYRCTNLETVTLPENLTTIGANSFDMCYNLKDINLPTTVTTIGNFAFRDCRKLTKFPSGGNVTSIGKNAFTGCTGITSLILPEPINTISENAFNGCKNMTTLSLPATTEYINSNAFSGCTALKDVFCLRTTVPGIASDSFGNLESGMTLYVVDVTAKTIYENATWWKNFKSITVKEKHSLTFYINDAEVGKIRQDGGTEIDESDVPTPSFGEGDEFSGWSESIPTTMPMEDKKFYGYVSKVREIEGYQYRLRPREELNGKNLPNRAELLAVKKELTGEDNHITLNSTVTYEETPYNLISIGDHAFQNQTIIQQITLPTSITSIGNAAFRGCTNMHTVNNFDGITEINDSVFFNCPALTKISLSDNITSIGRLAFGYCTSLNISTLPSKLTNISTQSFAYSGIKELTMSKNLKELGDEIFKECKGLETITFQNGFSLSLPKLTFWNCSALKNVTLVGTIGSIQEGAFQGCTSLTSMVIPEGISIIGNSTFKGCSQLKTITLPSSTNGINQKAFADCEALSQITVNSLEAPFAAGDAFSDKIHNTAWIFVQDISKYNNKDPWNNFTHISTKAEHKLTYKVDGVVKNEENIMVGTIIVPLPVPESTTGGTDFSGWINLPEIMPAQNVEVTGKFKYQLSYVLAEGSETPTNDLPEAEGLWYGDNIVLPASLEWAGHLCTTTYNDSPVPENFTMPASDVVLKVKYLQSEQETTIDNINYKVVLLKVNSVEPHAEVIASHSKTGDVDIPASITYNTKTYPVTIINDNAFNSNNSRSITGVTLHSGLEKIGARAFRDCRFTELTIPATVKNIGNEAFLYCTTLQKVSFEADTELTELPNGAFQSCSSLGSIELPEGLTTIGISAFAGCNALTAVKFPSTIDNIGDYAFSGSTAIETVTATSTNLPTATSTIFDNKVYENALLKVLTGTTHDDEPWKRFDKVQEGEDGGSGTVKCANPTISYDKGTLKFKSEEGATIVSDIKDEDITNTKDTNASPSTKPLTKKYIITAYAKKSGKLWSDEVRATITWRNGKPEFEGFTSVTMDDPVTKKGDIDGDDEITAQDASLILQHVAGKITIEE